MSSQPIDDHMEDIMEDMMKDAIREAEIRDRGQTRMEICGRRNWDGLCAGFVEFHTNGPRGGDAGHGGFVRVAFKNIASTHMEVSVDGAPAKNANAVAITFRGDEEIDAFIESIEFVAAKLRAMRKLC